MIIDQNVSVRYAVLDEMEVFAIRGDAVIIEALPELLNEKGNGKKELAQNCRARREWD